MGGNIDKKEYTIKSDGTLSATENAPDVARHVDGLLFALLAIPFFVSYKKKYNALCN